MTVIDKNNIDVLIDSGLLFVRMRSGRWWKLRRNGATRRGAGKNIGTFRLPYKYGLYGYGAIEQSDFSDGHLDSTYYRHGDDIPEKERA